MLSLKQTIEYLFYLFVFLLPLQTRWILAPGNINNGYWEYGTFSIYGTEILLWAILLLYFVYLIRTAKKEERMWNLSARGGIFLSCLGLLSISILSIAWALNTQTAWLSTFRLIEAIALWVFVVNFSFHSRRLFWVIVSSGFVQSMFAVLQFCTKNVFASKWLGMAAQSPIMFSGESVIETTCGRFLRAYGTFPHPNILGGFLAVAAILSIWLFLSSKNKMESVISLLFVIENMIGLGLTFSRSAYFAFILSSIICLAMAILYSKKSQQSQKGIFITLVFIFFVLAFSILNQGLVFSRINAGSRLEQKSFFERGELLQESIQIISRHPLLGAGIGNYTVAAHNEINPQKKSWEYQPVHSLYFLIASELGALGFLFFLSAIFLVCAYSWHKKNFIGFCIITSFIVIGFFDHYLWSLYPGIMLFWLGIGIATKK